MALLAYVAVLRAQAGSAHAQAVAPRVLGVEAREGRLSCLDRQALQREVLGADAATRISIVSSPAPDEGIVVLLVEGENRLAMRRIEPSEDDCAALTEAVSLVARTLLEANPRSSTLRAQSTTQAASARSALASELRADDTQVASNASSKRWGGTAQLGADGGLLGAWAATVSAGLTFRPSALELRADAITWLTPQQNRSGGTLDAWALGARLWVCGLRDVRGSWRAFACARSALGGLHAGAAGFPGINRESTSPFATLAPVLGLSWRNSFGFELALSGAVNIVVLRSELQLEVSPGVGRTLLSPAPISPGLDLTLSQFF